MPVEVRCPVCEKTHGPDPKGDVGRWHRIMLMRVDPAKVEEWRATQKRLRPPGWRPRLAEMVAARWLTVAAEKVPRVIRRRDESEALLASLSPDERTIIDHLASGRGRSIQGTARRITLFDTPVRKRGGLTDTPVLMQMDGGFPIVQNLVRKGWLRGAETIVPGYYSWFLTDVTLRVLELGT